MEQENNKIHIDLNHDDENIFHQGNNNETANLMANLELEKCLDDIEVSSKRKLVDVVPTRETLKQQVEEFVKEKIDSNFKFREYQEDTILDILENILSDKKSCHVIEAPTGSGKSLINIIASGVLAYYYKVRSFILASDLSLWDQYEDFIKKHRKLEYGVLKGLDNYKCDKNGEYLHEAECKLNRVPFHELFDANVAKSKGFPCAATCKYLKDRKKALKSDVTLLTYHLYLYLVGTNYMDTRGPIMDTRDVVFCDECHNIPDIMQLRYQFVLKRKHADYLYHVYREMESIQLSLFSKEDIETEIKKIKEKYPTIHDLEEAYTKCYNKLIDFNTTVEEDYDAIVDILKIWDKLSPLKEYFEEQIKEKIRLKKPISSADRDLLKSCKKFQMYISNSSIKLYLNIINKIGKKFLVKSIIKIDSDGKEINILENGNDKLEEGQDYNIRIQCAKEDYLSYMGLLSVTPRQVMVSATIGDKDNFEDTLGLKYTQDKEAIIDYLPSSFDYSKSPVFFLNRYKMSFKDRDRSLDHLIPIMIKILQGDMKNKRGMIQTGSYAIAKQIIDKMPNDIKERMLYYNGSKEKSQVLAMHQLKENSILIGPTLNEGIDLPGDLCRFIFILKMPYPQLKDRLVQAKINIFPNWYDSVTANAIIQGIGRGNRFVDDWCNTYIFDACFFKLYSNTINQFPDHIKKRIKIIN